MPEIKLEEDFYQKSEILSSDSEVKSFKSENKRKKKRKQVSISANDSFSSDSEEKLKTFKKSKKILKSTKI